MRTSRTSHWLDFESIHIWVHHEPSWTAHGSRPNGWLILSKDYWITLLEFSMTDLPIGAIMNKTSERVIFVVKVNYPELKFSTV